MEERQAPLESSACAKVENERPEADAAYQGELALSQACPCRQPTYNAFMTVQTFRDLLAQRPFRPFRLVMSSGQVTTSGWQGFACEPRNSSHKDQLLVG